MTWSSLRHALLIPALLATMAASVMGCSSKVVVPDSTMTEQQAFDELQNLLTLVESLVPGDWKDIGSGVRPCQLPSGAQGLYFRVASLGPGLPEDKQSEVILKMNEAFILSGISTIKGVLRESRPGDPITQLRSTETTSSDHIAYVELTVGKLATALVGHSLCVAGDPWGPTSPWDAVHPSVAPE